MPRHRRCPGELEELLYQNDLTRLLAGSGRGTASQQLHYQINTNTVLCGFLMKA
jgi:hypothetical protein